MIAVVTIGYIALILVIYKVLKIRPNPKNIAGMVVLGVVLIGAIVICWQFSAPLSKRLVVDRYTVALVPQVRGPITKINAKPNVPLTGGRDLLFEIQPDIYQNTVDQITQSLKAAERNIDQLEAGAIAAEAAVKKAAANRDASQAELGVAQQTRAANPDAISELKIQQLQQQFNAADAAVDQAKATSVQARIGKQAAESTAESLRAQLANAQFDLEQCKVYAPVDGFVTNWAVREGVMAVPLPLAPMGTFVDTSRVAIVGAYPQNTLMNVQPGDKAEVTFKTRPGEVFSAVVENVIQASGEGQSKVSGTLPSAAEVGSKGMLAVKFTLDDQKVAKELAMGTAGVAAIYTNSGGMFHIITKVTLRIKAWMYYLIPA